MQCLPSVLRLPRLQQDDLKCIIKTPDNVFNGLHADVSQMCVVRSSEGAGFN